MANRAVEPGQFVQGGTRLMALVPADGAYIEANFKETQLADLHAGQKAEISIDAFDGEVFEGHVMSLAPASGSEFSLLPPENATGNFTKITQRVPVKVSVPAELAAKLRPGLSVTVTVDTRDAGQRNNIMAATATIAGALQPPAKTGFNKRHLAAFLFMVFGMFMAILDIQIVSSSLAEIQAGISASADEISWVQTSYLIAEVVMIPLSGMLSRILSTRILFTVSAIGFTAMSFMCAMSGSINEMMRVAGAAGLCRRGHDPHGVCRHLHGLSGGQARDHYAADRPHRHAGADHRANRWRLSHRAFLVALAVPDQCHSRHRGGHRRVVAH